MEHMEPDREAQVWQRVLAAPQARQTADLRQLLILSGDLAAVYRRLVQDNPGKERLKKLYEGELADMACLRGMCALSGETVKSQIPQPSQEKGMKALPQCFHRARRAAAEYTARIADPEFGVIFEELAKRQRERCVLILGILGGRS